MIKEEFIDKIAVANETIGNVKKMVQKMEETKREAVQLYLETNIKMDPGQRVRVYYNSSDKNTDNKELLGFGYTMGAVVDEDNGLILYPIVKEDKRTKEKTDEKFEYEGTSLELGVLPEDFEYCTVLIEIA